MNNPLISSTATFRIYYYLTPVFILADIGADQSFRAAGLEAPYRYYYYGLCIVCALLCYTRQALSALVTLRESSTNMLILLLGVMVPIFTIGEAIDNGTVEVGLSGQRLVNFLLSGSMICWSFYQSPDKLKGVGPHHIKQEKIL